MNNQFKIAFVSGKLGDVDGVSLEVEKWIWALQRLGHDIYTFAGSYKTPLQMIDECKQFTIPEIRFNSPFQSRIESQIFPYFNEDTKLFASSGMIESLENEIFFEAQKIQSHMLHLIKKHEIDCIIGENTNAMPMSLVSGVALYKLVSEDAIAAIFHHHDFWWERSRFSNSLLEDLLSRTMPPAVKTTENVVISSYAKHTLKTFRHLRSYIIPNCENFNKAPVIDDYNKDFRKELGFKDDDILILQPTRIVPRKRIEDSVEFVAKLQEKYPELKERIHFIISLYQGDEPDLTYFDSIEDLAESKNINLHLIADRVSSVRGVNSLNQKMFSNRDVLLHADLVTYLPIWEGFGNALLEAIAAKVPIVTTTYLVYKTDIKPTGLDLIEIRDQYDKEEKLVFTEKEFEQVYQVLHDKEYRDDMIKRNFEIAQREFGYDALERYIANLFENYSDEIRASRRRISESKQRFSV